MGLAVARLTGGMKCKPRWFGIDGATKTENLTTERLEGTPNAYTVIGIGAPKATTPLDAETAPPGSSRHTPLGSERGRAAL